MSHIEIFIFSIAIAELINRFNTIELVQSLLNQSKTIMSLISSKNIDEHEKEVRLPKQAMSLLKKSFSLLFILLAIIIIFLIFNEISEDFYRNLLSFFGIFESIFFYLIYVRYLRGLIF
tara:strand:- start:57 stop:413 length:357 start_codon:yes stop_codon:yes gene_type:complete